MARPLQSRQHYLIAALAAAAVSGILVLPHILYGYPNGASANFNYSWTHFFLSQFFSGDLYPRWLTDYGQGLGAPVFYFYAPAPFYLAAILKAVGCPGCDPGAVLSLLHWTVFTLSGITFYIWVSHLTERWSAAVAAICYLVSPYHVLDLEMRNTLGEGMAFVWLPLIFLGIRRSGFSMSAVLFGGIAYAGLILSHLPSALLATPFMILFSYILTPSPKDIWRTTRRLAAMGFLGLGLSAIYLLPALNLQSALPAAAWTTASGPLYFPEHWLLPGGHHLKGEGLIFPAVLAWSTGLVLLGMGISWRKVYNSENTAGVGSDAVRILIAFVLSVAVCWLLMSELSRWLWINIDILRQVQFPWRLGTILEFANATLLAILLPILGNAVQKKYPDDVTSPKLALYGIVIVLFVAPLIVSAGPALQLYKGRDHTAIIENADPPVEYRPKWVVNSRVYRAAAARIPEQGMVTTEKRHDAGQREWIAHVTTTPEIAVREGRGTAHLSRRSQDNFTITADLSAPATLVVRRTYFPHWRLYDTETGQTIALRPTADAGLIAFDRPAGRHRLNLTTACMPSEIAGGAISALTLAGIVGGCLYRRREVFAKKGPVHPYRGSGPGAQE